RFYIELMAPPSMPDLKLQREQLIKIARELNLPLVATNDVHYISMDDAEAQDALICVQTRKLISEDKRMKMIDHPDFYLKSSQEMKELFRDYPEAIENTVKIAESVQLEIPTGKLNFPIFELPSGETQGSYLEKLAFEGRAKKIPEVTEEMKQRLHYEL